MTDPAADAPAAPTKMQVFARRLVSTLILWGVVLGALFSGHDMVADFALLGIMLLIACFGLLEYFGMLRRKGARCFPHFGVVAGTVFTLASFAHYRWEPAFPLVEVTAGLIVFALFVRRLLRPEIATGTESVSLTLLGLVYVAGMLHYLQGVYFITGEQGAWFILYFVIVTKFSDVGGYCVGSLLGRHKMFPRISPGKTWEGFFGAVGVATLASLTFAHFAQSQMPGVMFWHALVLGVLLGTGAVAGDLVESLLKRETGVKDSGGFLPGIGGVLDLVDSLLFNAPVMYAFLFLIR